MLLAITPESNIGAVAMAQDVRAGAREQEPAPLGASATEPQRLLEITVGRTVYPLVRPVSLSQTWSGSAWVCWASELGFLYQGEGQTLSEAERDWAQRVHADFQRLYSMRPHEMDDCEADRWQALLNVIDIAFYRDETPIPLREIGRVRWDKLPYPSRVFWIDGRKEGIPFDNVPSDLARCPPGQWIEAIVRRHPKTGQLLGIDYVQLIEPIHTPSDAELTREWEAMTKADLPEEEWDWPAHGTRQPDVGTASDK